MIDQPKIDKGVPLPQAGTGHRHSGFNLRALLRSMEIGDSFVMPAAKGVTPQHLQRRVLSSVQSLKPLQFSCRIMLENGTRVVRVWRTK